MRVLFALDQWILGELEKFAHLFQKLTGKDNFWLARAAAIVLTILFIVPSWIFLPFSLLVLFNYLAGIFVAERTTYRNISQGLKNSFAQSREMAYARMAFLVVMFFFPTLLLSTKLFHVFLWLYLEFVSCTPLPPCKSKIGEWVKALTAKPVDATPQQV